MSWSSKRRIIVLSIMGGILATVITVTAIAIFYETPSCTDRKQNQDESGVDCGGACTRVCEAQSLAPSVEFVRPLMPQVGRTDVIAYVVNPNTKAIAKDVPYTIELYGENGSVIAQRQGTVDLPPGATLPIFIPQFYLGTEPVERAFLTFATSTTFVTYEDKRIIPRYNDDAQITGTDSPRITASFSNPSAYPVRNIPVIATVFDSNGIAIAASQTLLAALPPQGSAQVTFVWNQPFIASPARVDVVPLVEL